MKNQLFTLLVSCSTLFFMGNAVANSSTNDLLVTDRLLQLQSIQPGQILQVGDKYHKRYHRHRGYYNRGYYRNYNRGYYRKGYRDRNYYHNNNAWWFGLGAAALTSTMLYNRDRNSGRDYYTCYASVRGKVYKGSYRPGGPCYVRYKNNNVIAVNKYRTR